MSIRVHKTKSRFTTISNDLINDSTISWAARGLLIYLMSKPEGWIIRNSDLINQSPAGRDKVAAILKELEYKYLFRWETRTLEGLIEWKSEVFESPEDLKVWVSERPNLISRNGKTVDGSTVHGKSAKKGSDRNGKTVSGSTVDGSTVNGKGVPLVITDLPNTELINTDQENTDQDPECAIEDIKTCQVEICLEPEPIEASQPLALDQTGIPLTVKRSKKGGDKFSAPGAVSLVSPAATEKPVEVDTPTTVCDDIGDGGYERFRAKYTDLCVDVHRKYGKSEDVKKAWKAAWKGLEPPDRFWFGLDCYIKQQQTEYSKTGECWMVGAKRFLDADEVHWESAIRKHEVSQKTQSFGVDIDSPSSMKRANIVSSNQKNWAIARQQLIAEGRAV